MADLLTFAEGLSLATAVGIAGLMWQMARARKSDARETEARIRKRAERESDIDHRLAALEHDFESHKTEGKEIVQHLDELKTEITKLIEQGRSIVRRLESLEKRRD